MDLRASLLKTQLADFPTQEIHFQVNKPAYIWTLFPVIITIIFGFQHNSELAGIDLNVTGVWALGITGTGVTVAIVDDGLEWDHPDLEENYNPAGSIDLNNRDDDPMPDERPNHRASGKGASNYSADTRSNACFSHSD